MHVKEEALVSNKRLSFLILLRLNTKLASQSLALLVELLLHKYFVRDHEVLKLKELTGLRVFQVFWLVNFLPNLLDVSVKNTLDLFEIVPSVVKVPQHKQELFGGLLIEQLQIDLKDHSQQTIVGSLISTNILLTFIN